MSAPSPLLETVQHGQIGSSGGLEGQASSSGLNHVGSSAHWHPPVPSMAALPVDTSKTEPKPAYYKLQFGDDYTGFSYYVRTLGIIIGRKCEKPMEIPPPDITSSQVPNRPPLKEAEGEDGDGIGAVKFEQTERDNAEVKEENRMEEKASSGDEELEADLSLLDPQLMAQRPSDAFVAQAPAKPTDQELNAVQLRDTSVASEAGKTGGEVASEPVESSASVEQNATHTAMQTAADPALTQASLTDQQQGIILQEMDHGGALGKLGPVTEGTAAGSLELASSEEHLSDAEIIQAMLGGPPPPPPMSPPPPPPPARSSAPVEHVDVDLGPLKSVSRNHAKIEFRPDLGHFCLDIYGRNGAWVDDRYYVKGSAVPLYQGSVIQIATRIFSFILPPSPGGSPITPSILDSSFDSNAALDDVPYPYNLPASQVGFEEFFGEALAGSAVPAVPHQVPQPFNAFTAADGEGLGLGMEYDWSQDKRKGRHHWTQEWSSEDSEDSLDSWDESDEVEDREISRRRRRRRRADQGESELSSVDEESDEGEDYYEEEEENEDDYEEEEEDEEDAGEDDDMEAGKGDAASEVAEQQPSKLVQHKGAGRPKSDSVSTNRRESLASVVMKEEEGWTAPAPARTGKGPAKSGKLPAKSVKAVKAMKAAAAAQQKADEKEDQIKDDKGGNADDVAGGKKPKIGKANKLDKGAEAQPVGTASAQADAKVVEKTKPPTKKATTKKAKAAPAAAGPTVPASAPSQLNQAVPAAPAAPPPTLAAALAASAAVPTPTTTSATAVATPVRPPVPTPAPPIQTVRPPSTAPVRPPVRPPTITHQAPATPRPAPIQAISAQATAASSPGGTPEPSKPFYLTELIETPGRPGHIIVNVPIPPSGAGPRPPPGPLIGLDGEVFIGPPPIKPTATFAIIIYTALAHLPRGRGTLGEVCNWIAGEWEWFRLNVDTGWQNSIRHNLSLNKAFLKVPRIPEDDPESKGSVWIIDPKEGPIFEEKQRKEAQKSEGKTRTAEMRAVKERQKGDDKGKKDSPATAAPAKSATTAATGVGAPATPAPVAPQAAAAVGSGGPPVPPKGPAGTGAMPRVAAPVPSAPTAVSAASTQTQNQPRPPAVRPTPVAVRPAPRPPAAAAAPPPPKGPILTKERVAVSFNEITPALRAASLIQSLDNEGNPLPFVCTATDLILDRAAFGHLSSDITEKLHSLGAHTAVEVLISWINNKKKLVPARPAATATATAAAAGQSKVAPSAGTAGTAAASVRPAPARPNGAAKQARPPATSKAAAAAQAKAAAAANAHANGKTAGPTASATSNGPGRPPAAASNAGAGAGKAAGSASGPSLPAGSTITQIISLIAAAAAQGRDIQTVGKHASALLRYIKMVGMKVDVKVAERVWTTGIVPPNPNAGAKAGMMQNGAARNGVKPNGAGTQQAQGVVRKVGAVGGAAGGAGNGNLSPALQAKLPLKHSPSPAPLPGTKLPSPNTLASPSPGPAPTPPLMSPVLPVAANAATPIAMSKPAASTGASTQPARPAQPAQPTQPAASVAPAQSAAGGMKRKLEDSEDGGSAGALAINSASSLAEAEAKKPRLEAGTA